MVLRGFPGLPGPPNLSAELAEDYIPKERRCAKDELEHVIWEADRRYESYSEWKRKKTCDHEFLDTSGPLRGPGSPWQSWKCKKCGATGFYDATD